MTADVKKLPVDPIDRTLYQCPECKGKFKQEPYKPIIMLPAQIDVRVVKLVFAFLCPYCSVEIHVTYPSENEKADVIPIKRKP